MYYVCIMNYDMIMGWARRFMRKTKHWLNTQLCTHLCHHHSFINENKYLQKQKLSLSVYTGKHTTNVTYIPCECEGMVNGKYVCVSLVVAKTHNTHHVQIRIMPYSRQGSPWISKSLVEENDFQFILDSRITDYRLGYKYKCPDFFGKGI